MAWEIPNPWPRRRRSGLSRNQAREELRLLPAGQGTGPVRGGEFLPVFVQEVRNLDHELDQDVQTDAIRGQRSLRVDGLVVRPLVPGAPRFPGDLHACLRVCPDGRYAVNVGFTLAEKTSLFNTPNYPEYLSGYNAFNSTVVHGLQNLFRPGTCS